MLDLEALGISKEELQDRIVERAVERLFETAGMDEYGDEVIEKSPLAGRLEKAVRSAIEARVSKIAEDHVLPITGELVESIVLQETNQWGEKKGTPVTFREFLVQRADAYLREPVDYHGLGKSESRDSYNWNSKNTRVVHLIHQHFDFRIKEAMEQAVKVANESIAGGIQEAVKVKLAEVVNGLKVQVQTK